MRAIAVALLVGAMVGMIISAVLPATAQPVMPADQAIVGAWTAGDGISLSFFADGNLITSDSEGNVFHGVWRVKTAEDGADPTLEGQSGDVLFTMARMVSRQQGEGLLGVIEVGEGLDVFSYNGKWLSRIDFPPLPSEVAPMTEDGTPVASSGEPRGRALVNRVRALAVGYT